MKNLLLYIKYTENVGKQKSKILNENVYNYINLCLPSGMSITQVLVGLSEQLKQNNN